MEPGCFGYNEFMNLPKYQWEDFKHPRLKLLREKFELEKVVEGGENEFEKQSLLKSWVNQKLPLGYNPKKEYKDALEILTDKNGEFYCSHYALVFIQCATVFGWYSRKLGIDYDHLFGVEEKHHGVVDIWSNDFRKWYIIDAMHDLHFEKDGFPLNSLEIRQEYLKDKAKNVVGVIGNHQSMVTYREETFGFDQPSNYFWFFILLRNDFLENPNIYDSEALLWTDEFNKGKVWYKGGGKKGESKPHPMYKSQFIKTNDFNLCFPMM